MVQNLHSIAKTAFLFFASLVLLCLVSALSAVAQTAATTTDTIAGASEVVVAFTLTTFPSSGFIESATFDTSNKDLLSFNLVHSATPALAANNAPMTTNGIKLWLYGAASVREPTDSYVPLGVVGNYGFKQYDVSKYNALRLKITSTGNDATIRMYGKLK